MNVLCVCDEGNNRSVHIAHRLRYTGHDTIPVGANTASDDTRLYLAGWADRVIFTDPRQRDRFPTVGDDRAVVWPIPDVYARPFNPAQDAIVNQYIAGASL